MNKKAIVMGAGGFIGSHMVKRLKKEGYYVKGVDLKKPEFSNTEADDFIIGDLRDPKLVADIIGADYDELYQFAADMGGAGYIFTGENDANVMHNSAMINLNVIKEFFSERNIVICKEITKYYEEFFRSKVSDLKAFKNLKGEITIVISELNNKKKASNNLNESDKKKIGMLIKKLSTKEIVNLLNYEKNISKKEIYNYCLSLKK